jgi:hypothetical protein
MTVSRSSRACHPAPGGPGFCSRIGPAGNEKAPLMRGSLKTGVCSLVATAVWSEAFELWALLGASLLSIICHATRRAVGCISFSSAIREEIQPHHHRTSQDMSFVIRPLASSEWSYPRGFTESGEALKSCEARARVQAGLLCSLLVTELVFCHNKGRLRTCDLDHAATRSLAI